MPGGRRSEHLAWVEIDDDVRPGFVFLGGKIVGRAARHGAARGFRGGAFDAGAAAAGDDLGAAFQRAGRSSLNLTETRRSPASAAPAGMFQQRCTWPRNASISLCDSLAPPVVLSPPSDACLGRALGAAARGLLLVEECRHLVGVEFLLLGFRLGRGLLDGLFGFLAVRRLGGLRLGRLWLAPPAPARPSAA